MCTLENATTDVVDFLGPKMVPTNSNWCTAQRVHESWQQRLCPSPNVHNGRGRLQPNYMVDESPGHCSRKLFQRPKFVPHTEYNKIEQLKLVHIVVDVEDRPNRQICVPLLPYNVNKPETFQTIHSALLQIFLAEPLNQEEHWRLQFRKNPTHRCTKMLQKKSLSFLKQNFQTRHILTIRNTVSTTPLRILSKP